MSYRNPKADDKTQKLETSQLREVKKEMEEKTKLARQLEQELGIKNPYEQERKDKSSGIDIKLKHIKDAKKITDKEYAEEFNTNEHKFIKQSKRNLRSKYGL